MTQNIIATIITLALSLAWLRLMDALAHRGVIDQKLSRKIIHIGTDRFLFCAGSCSTMNPSARYLAALVPLLITVQFILVGVGVIKDEAAVKAMTRSGNPREILRGPLSTALPSSSARFFLAQFARRHFGVDDDVRRRWIGR